MSTEQIKFPFEPNEKVKAAFRNQSTLERMTAIITEALLTATTGFATNPWQILRKEHPELTESSKQLIYNQLDEKIEMRTK